MSLLQYLSVRTHHQVDVCHTIARCPSAVPAGAHHLYLSPPLPQEKERLKAEKDAAEKKYKTAKVDGRVEQVTRLLSALRCCAPAHRGQPGPTQTLVHQADMLRSALASARGGGRAPEAIRCTTLLNGLHRWATFGWSRRVCSGAGVSTPRWAASSGASTRRTSSSTSARACPSPSTRSPTSTGRWCAGRAGLACSLCRAANRRISVIRCINGLLRHTLWQPRRTPVSG